MTFAYRQDFGFGNPNMAGAFFAVLVLAVFLIPSRGRWTRALRLLISGVFFGCLLLTASRGALIGLGLGGFAAWAAVGFPRPKIGWLVLAVALSGFLGMRTIQRMSCLSPSEGSTASRIAIYRCVPAMVMAAPGGWGYGRAASAYENWFQGPDDTTSFKNLLSTHATWIVEHGLLFFVCYAALWIAALWMCHPVALGVLVTWGTCCAFSHVGGAWWMWFVPALALLGSLRDRWKRNAWPPRTAWISAAAILTLIFVLFFGASTKAAIHYEGRVVRVGSGAPELWFLAPDFSVMGKTHGKNLRALGNIAVAQRWADVQSPLVLSGNAPDPPDSSVCESVIWLNPPARISPQLRRLVEKAPRKIILWGDLRSDANPVELRSWFESLPGACWVVVPGRGKYLGDVLDRVTKLSRDFCCGPLAPPLLPNAPVLEKLEPLQKTPP